VSPDQPAQTDGSVPNDSGTGVEDATTDRGRWADDVWQHAIDDTDIVVSGVVYDGSRWESDGEGGVRPRLYGDERIARDLYEADLEQRRYEAPAAADADVYTSDDLDL
jgi:hypothetical protein